MSLIKCTNNVETAKTEFKKALDKFAKTKWLCGDCIPDKNDKILFPLIHWACILGKYKVLEYLVSEKGFQLTGKRGENQEGPLFSMAQHFSFVVNPKSSNEYTESMIGHVIDIFLKYMPEALCEKEIGNDDSILHCCAKRCSSDPCSRAFLKILLLKIKESDKFSIEKEDNFLSTVNKKGDTFLHLMVVDEKSTETLNYLFGNFVSASEKLSKTKNNQGKTPRQIAVENRSFEMLRGLGAPDIVINSLKKAVGSSGNPPKISCTAKNSPQQKERGSAKSAAKTSYQVNDVSSSKDQNQSSEALLSKKQTPVQETESTSPGDQQEVRVINADELQMEGLTMCSCDAPAAEVTEKPADCNTPTKRTIEPFPQRYPAKDVTTVTSEKPGATTESATENNVNTSLSAVAKEVKIDVDNVDNSLDLPDDKEANHIPSDCNVLLSLSNTVSSFSKEEPVKSSQKRPAPGPGGARGPNKKRVRMTLLSLDSEGDAVEDADSEPVKSSQKRPAPGAGRARGPNKKRVHIADSDSESDAEEDADLVLDDDSDDDIESAAEEEGDDEEEEEGEKELQEDEKEKNTDVCDDQEKEATDVQLDETEIGMEAGEESCESFYKHTCYTAGV